MILNLLVLTVGVLPVDWPLEALPGYPDPLPAPLEVLRDGSDQVLALGFTRRETNGSWRTRIVSTDGQLLGQVITSLNDDGFPLERQVESADGGQIAALRWTYDVYGRLSETSVRFPQHQLRVRAEMNFDERGFPASSVLRSSGLDIREHVYTIANDPPSLVSIEETILQPGLLGEQSRSWRPSFDSTGRVESIAFESGGMPAGRLDRFWPLIPAAPRIVLASDDVSGGDEPQFIVLVDLEGTTATLSLALALPGLNQPVQLNGAWIQNDAAPTSAQSVEVTLSQAARRIQETSQSIQVTLSSAPD